MKRITVADMITFLQTLDPNMPVHHGSDADQNFRPCEELPMHVNVLKGMQIPATEDVQYGHDALIME